MMPWATYTHISYKSSSKHAIIWVWNIWNRPHSVPPYYPLTCWICLKLKKIFPLSIFSQCRGWLKYFLVEDKDLFVQQIQCHACSCLVDATQEASSAAVTVLIEFSWNIPVSAAERLWHVYEGVDNLHDDVIKWRHFPRYWPFVRWIHRSPVNSPHKGQWRGALMFSLICALNKRLSKQSWGWWFQTPSCSLWRHCNVIQSFEEWGW